MTFQPGKAPFEVYGEDRRCCAKSKQAHRRCRQLAAPGSDKCRYHGGWSLRGRDHPGFRHGERSQQGRAEMVVVNSLGRAMQMLDRAETPEEIRVAGEFARNAMATKPGQG